MSGIATNHIAVLDAVIARLLATIDQLKPSTCFLSLDTRPSIALQSNLFVTVAPMGGIFNVGVFDGGGRDGVLEETGVIVSAFSAMRLDRMEHAAKVLSDNSRGLLIMKHRVLDALAGHDLQDFFGNSLLTSLMQPVNSGHPQEALYGEHHVGFSLAFSTPFEWDLSAGAVP